MQFNLLPQKFKYSGYLSLLSGLCLSYLFFFLNVKPEWLNVKVFAIYSSYVDTKILGLTGTNLLDELAFVLLLCGLAMIALAKEKHEKESFMTLRGRAHFLSVLTNLIFLILAYLLVFGKGILVVLVVNVFSQLILYLIIFRVLLIRQAYFN